MYILHPSSCHFWSSTRAVMGLLLFLTFINDMPEHTQSEARLLHAIPENNQNNECRATPTRPNIASGLGTTVANRISSTEMYSDPHLQQEIANKDEVYTTLPHP
jgi:hypothetical protein